MPSKWGSVNQLREDPIPLLSTPTDHRNLIAPDQSRDLIAWHPGRKPAWPKIRSDAHKAMQDQLSRWVGQPDIYITPNEFHGWRLIMLLRRINALYVDIDHHQTTGKVDMVRMAAEAMDNLERAHVPPPNVIVYTGRGIHLYWTLKEGLSGRAMPRWQACQRELVGIVEGDKQSADVTRVLRMIGSTNSKANNWKVTAEVVVPDRYSFDELADAVLPLTRAEIRDLRVARANKEVKEGERHKRTRNSTGSIFDRWCHVYQDVHRIIDFHWFGGVPEGHRNKVLFHLANSLSWFTKHHGLENEIAAVASTQLPSLSYRDVQTYTKPIVERAKRAAKGEWQRYGEKDVDPRYKFKRQTLYDSLSDLIPDDLLPELRAIIPNELARERKKERDKARFKDSNTGQGVRKGNAGKRAEAVKMRSQGLPVEYISKTLGVGVASIYRWTKPSRK